MAIAGACTSRPCLRALLQYATPVAPVRSGGLAAASLGTARIRSVRAMATFRVDGDIPVTLRAGLPRETSLGFPPLQNWLETLRRSPARQTGLRDEGEKLTLKLVKMKDLWRAGVRDAKCLAALALWEGPKREGKV